MSPAVLVQVRECHPRRLGAGQDLRRLLLHLAEQPVELGPAVRVRLVEVQVRAGEVADQLAVALPADRVRRTLDGRGVHVPHPVAQLHHGPGGRAGGLVQFTAQRLGARRREVLEPAAPRTVRVRPLGELADERRGRAGARVQLALQAEREGRAVPGVRRRHRAQSLRDRRPVLLGLGRGDGEDLAHLVRRRDHVADRTQPLVGLVHGQFRRQALAQQARAPALGVTVRARLPFGLVEPRERRPDQLRPGLLTHAARCPATCWNSPSHPGTCRSRGRGR